MGNEKDNETRIEDVRDDLLFFGVETRRRKRGYIDTFDYSTEQWTQRTLEECEAMIEEFYNDHNG